MARQEVAASLRKRWSSLRRDIVFLPRLDGMAVSTEEHGLEAVEFVRVAPSDEEVMVPSAPHVTVDDVRDYPGWSDAEEDQQVMWALAGTQIEGNRTTHTCPECDGSKRLTCDRCRGGGRVTCTWCSGSGQTCCSSCGGSGGRHVSQTTTDSDGNTSTTTDWESCSSCGGSGRDRCSSCWGSGQVTCHTCGGSGELTCTTCSDNGTVDRFIRRSFLASTVATQILPVGLPGYPEPVALSPRHVEIHPREAATPCDAVADQSLLERRQVAAARARLFFIRQATATLHSVVEPETGRLCATFIDGEPTPVLTLHQTVQDPGWTPDRERQRALLAFILYGLSPLVLLGFLAAQPLLPGMDSGTLVAIGLVAAALVAGGAVLLYRNPVRAFRMAFLDLRCPRHGATATMRCPSCGKELCHECLMDSVRCPECGQVVSGAVTHLVEGGRWVKGEQAG